LVIQVRFWIALLCVDEIAEFQRIANEENRRVISHHIPIAFLCVKLQGNPRGSRAVSAEPFSPPTVENRMKVGVFLPTVLNSFAVVYLVISALVHTK